MRYLFTADVHLDSKTEDFVFPVLDHMFSAAKDLNVDYLGILGDVYHVRHTVPVATQNKLANWLYTTAQDIPILILPGNHDQIDIEGRHALEVMAHIPNVTMYTEMCWDEHGLWLPFRRDREVLLNFIKENPKPFSSTNVAFLHHGIEGAFMNDHTKATSLDGIPPEAFTSFEYVFMGHWHRHQVIKNCVYCGSPWQTRADETGQQKGFVLFDSDTMKWEFIPCAIGRKFHKSSIQDLDTSSLKTGDRVTILLDKEDDPEEVVSKLATLGVEVVLKAKDSKSEINRLGLDFNSSAETYAKKYAEQHYSGKDLDKCLEVLKVIVEGM